MNTYHAIIFDKDHGQATSGTVEAPNPDAACLLVAMKEYQITNEEALNCFETGSLEVICVIAGQPDFEQTTGLANFPFK